ncbi:dihydroneopterin aldolase [Micrococcus cohnii]|uniref:7,8-dihydroneopterin aldolase n=1 Tax=Micrococcus cohnii TaxID=993416 RepID=A0A7W7GQC2_9MICC|nr:dihydroneopterin aldolase [Micrococcus cohnii]MBB4736334.1 dihydroneopterin aldolase [Micrococcus cohnii]
MIRGHEHRGRDRREPPTELDRITLTGLTAYGYHGVLHREKREGQRFVTDVVMHVDAASPAESDDLALTVNYAEVADTVIELVTGESLDLIETLAERIAGAVLRTQPLVHVVEVTVHKPQAPIPHEFVDVSVTVRRVRGEE